MHRYFIKTPWLVKKLFPNYIWHMPPGQNSVYLTFDDGPHPEITPWVLDELNKYDAKAVFFCIGNNVHRYPQIYQRILDEGHAVGNHTYHHLNGWKTSTDEYLRDIKQASVLINTNLFRPPYGRVKRRQAKDISRLLGTKEIKIIMWDVLSADFDSEFSPQQCLDHIRKNTKDGSIIVFHDSAKAFKNLQYVLPESLEFLKREGYILKKIEL